MSPTVSVVVPTKDRCILLNEALRSIHAVEGSNLSFEIIVADNGSTDDTEAVAGRHGARFVRTLAPGAAATRNEGLRAATCEFIAFLDDDDAWLPGHIRPHLERLRTEPELMAVVGQVANATSDLSSHGAFWPSGLPARGDLFREFLAIYPQIGATVVRRSVLESVGYFDESLTYDQDWDWHLRIALRHAVGFVEEPCVLFRQRPLGQNDALQWKRMAFTRRVFARNIRRAGWRRSPPPHKLARIYTRKFGSYYSYFAESALAHGAGDDRAAGRKALLQAFAASPPHWLRDLLRPGPLRPALRALV